jgi:hypothetical protein
MYRENVFDDDKEVFSRDKGSQRINRVGKDSERERNQKHARLLFKEKNVITNTKR